MSAYLDWARSGWNLEDGCWRVMVEMMLENGIRYTTDEDALLYLLRRRSLGLPAGRPPKYYSERDQNRNRKEVVR